MLAVPTYEVENNTSALNAVSQNWAWLWNSEILATSVKVIFLGTQYQGDHSKYCDFMMITMNYWNTTVTYCKPSYK
jgi:hypothetical protein